MSFQLFGNTKTPTLLLIPGLGVSHEIVKAKYTKKTNE